MSAAGIKPDTQKLAAIIDMVPPTNVTEVRCFLGMVNQLAKFSPRLPKLSTTIRELTAQKQNMVVGETIRNGLQKN